MGTVLSQVASHLPRRTFVRLVALQYLVFEPELRHISPFVPRDRIAIDVGTWWGPWSWWLAKRVQRVEAFEPNASVCDALSAVLPPNVTLHNVALSDVHGEALLWSPGTELGTEGRSTIVGNGRSGWLSQQVQTVPLDEFGYTDVGFVKIDVEGAELSVLHGAHALLQRERPTLLVEIEEVHQSPDGMDRVFAFLEDLGYRGKFLRRGEWRPLGEFDREEARRIGLDRKSMGLLRSSFARESYVHNFLFVT